MAQRTKKQHLVPRFYLSKFSDPNGMVWTFAPNTNPLGRKPDATAVQTNFYSPIGADGKRVDVIEDALGQIESAAAPVWPRAIKGGVLKGEERDAVALFVAAQYLRSPAMVQAGAEMMANMMHQFARLTASNKDAHDHTIDQYEADTGNKFDPKEREEMRKFISDPNNLKINVLRDAGLPVLGAIGDLADRLFAMNWRVGHSGQQHLITSDNPVTRTTDPATHHPFYGDGGFANKSIRVHFPLTPDRILEMTWTGENQDFLVEMPKQMARAMNKTRAMQAHRFLYASENDPGIKKLCDRWVEHRAISKVISDPKAPEIEVKRRL